MADTGLAHDTRHGRDNPGKAISLAYGVFFGLFALLLVFIAVRGDPMDGEPSVSLEIKPAPFPKEVNIPGPLPAPRTVNGQVVADPALLEKTPFGLLPVTAADGRKPVRVYRASFDASDKRPRIALVIGGLGLSVSATKLALSHLPAAITLSFAPYASNLQPWVDAARGLGHEVLVEIPMEPLDYPASDPGPHTLLAAAGIAENTKQLYWAMARATGYIGVTNLLGGRFLADSAASAPILAEVDRRGLLFFDNGAHSAIQKAKGNLLMSALVIDSVQDGREIAQKLGELEVQARGKGSVIASGIVYPETVQQVSEWAHSLEARGIVLAPMTALMSRDETGPTK